MNIDDMISAPLSEVSDNGFSNRVIAEVMQSNMRRQRRQSWLLSGFTAGLCLVMPFTPLGREIGDAISSLTYNYMLPLSIVAAVLLVTYAAVDYARR